MNTQRILMTRAEHCSAIHALLEHPELADMVFEAISSERIALLRSFYSKAPIAWERVWEDFEPRYSLSLMRFAAQIPKKEAFAAQPDYSLAVALCAITFTNTLDPSREDSKHPRVKLPPISEETRLDTLAIPEVAGADEVLCEELGKGIKEALKADLSSEDELIRWFMKRTQCSDPQHIKRALRRKVYVGTDSESEIMVNIRHNFHGITPELVEKIVKIGEDQNALRVALKEELYYVKSLLSITEEEKMRDQRSGTELILKLHAICQEHHEKGLDFRTFTILLQALSKGHELVEAYQPGDSLFFPNLHTHSGGLSLVEKLGGKWMTVHEWLIPFLWPPAHATAGLIMRQSPEMALVSIARFTKRIRERDKKRKYREKKRENSKSIVKLDASPGGSNTSEDDSTLVHELIPDKPVSGSNRDSLLRMIANHSYLTPRQKAVAKLRGELGCTQKETALKLGISQPRVSQIEKKSLEKAYNRLVNMKDLSNFLQNG